MACMARGRSVSSRGPSPGPGRSRMQRRGLLDDPAGEVERLAQAAPVEDEPLAAVAARVEPRKRSREQVERTAHRVEQDQMAAADAPHRLEAAQRVAQHLQHVAHHDEVELADLGRVELVDAQVAQLDARAEQLGREREVPLRVAAVPLTAQPVGDEVVEPRRVEDVARDDLARPAALELERPEAVHRPDVEAAHAGERRRPRQPLRRGPQIPAAGRDDARRDLDRVPPIELGDARPRSVSVRRRHPSEKLDWSSALVPPRTSG